MAEVQLLNQEQIDQLERQILENEAAKERNEPPPHVITKETMRLAVQSLRAQRGTVRTASKGKAKGASVAIDVDDLMGGA